MNVPVFVQFSDPAPHIAEHSAFHFLDIGLDQDEISEAYKTLNLGLARRVFGSGIIEREGCVG